MSTGPRHAVALAVLVATIASWLVGLPGARAVLATGGSGRFVNEINWITWGTIPANLGLPGGPTTHSVTNNLALGDKTLAVTCTLSDVARTGGAGAPLLTPYRPGSWRGDGLDDLYNIGGPEAANTLANGLLTPTSTTVAFAFSCSAALDGQPFPLPGLVMADAEQEAFNEYVQATIPTGTWRMIDRFRSAGCLNDQPVSLSADGRTLQLGPNPAGCPEGPMSVAFMDGTTSANVTMRGGGRTAIGLGVMISPADHGDAPASYGDGANLQPTTFSGGTLTPGTTTGAFATSLATINPPTPRFGAAVDGEVWAPVAPEAPATSDDSDRVPDDEDGVTVPPTIPVDPGGSYTLPGVSCTGPGVAAAWLDWNNDGDFADAGERSDEVTCPAGTSTVAFTWPSIPLDVRPARPTDPTYLRLRVGPDAAAVASPTGTVLGGETEDHTISRLDVATVTLTKSVPIRVDPGDQFRVRLLDGATTLASATTAGTATSATTTTLAVRAGRTYVVDDTLVAGPSSPDAYTRTVVCVDTSNGDAPVATSGSGPAWSLPPLSPAQTVSCTVTNTPIRPALTLDKSITSTTDPDGNGLDAGDTVVYSFVVTNSGEGPVSAVSVADPLVTGITCPPVTLAPTESVTCTGSTVVTQAQVDLGRVDNTAVASGTTPVGPVTSAPDSASIPTATTARVALDKSVAAINDLDGNGLDAGDTIGYSFLVTNTGVVTLSAVTVDDPKTAPVSCPGVPVAPGASITCTSTYTVTQLEVDAGIVANTATATARTPAGQAVTSLPDSTATPTSTTAAITLDKSIASTVDGNGSGHLDVGDTVSYELVVTNSGVVTLTGVAVDDPKVGPVACPVTTLPPGGSTTCTATYTVTQADVDAGSVDNTATASATTPTGSPVTSPPGSTTVPTATDASLALDKSVTTVDDVDGNGVDAGDRITYDFLVTNTGIVTLADVAVDDSKVGAVSCPVTTLGPGEETTCTAAYTVTQADVDRGGVDNRAQAGGTSPTGVPVLSNEDSASVPTSTTAAVTLDKSVSGTTDVDGDGALDAGDRVTYSMVVTNTGVVTLEDLVVDDPLGAVSCPVTSLPPGEATTCTMTYAVTDADVEAGGITNTATVRGVPANGGPDVEATSSARVPTGAPPTRPVPPELARTGSDTASLALGGLGLVVLGGVVVAIRRRAAAA